MQIRNNYDKDVYNGDIGRIVGIDREEQEVSVNFDGKIIPYEFSELDELVLAYATSVHKAQGSEYPAVVMPLLTQHYILLQRNLLYTGITRGQEARHNHRNKKSPQHRHPQQQTPAAIHPSERTFDASVGFHKPCHF